MKRSHAPHAHMAPVDIVGIPESQLREHLEHILADDSAHAAEPQSLLGLVSHLAPMRDVLEDVPPAEDTEGHEDMLPQLRLVDALLGKSPRQNPQPERRPFADVIAAEQYRRQRRKRLSRRADSVETLPPPSPQAENDRLLLEEIGGKPSHPRGGWVAEAPEPSPPPADTVDNPPPPPFSLGDEVMDGFVSMPVSPPHDMSLAEGPEVERTAPADAEPRPPISLKVRRKEKPPISAFEVPPPEAEPPAELAAAAPEVPTPPQDQAAAKPAVKMKVKGRPRRHTPEAPPPAAEPPAELAAAAPEVPTPPQDQAAAKPTVKMKVKGRPRRHAPEAPPPAAEPPAEIAAAAPEVPTPPQDQSAAKPAVKMKVKGKPRRHAPEAPPPAAEPPAELAAAVPEVPTPPQDQSAAKPAVKMKVKGRPRRHTPEAPPPEAEPPAELAAAAPEVPTPPQDQAAAKPAVKMKVKGKPRRPAADVPPATAIDSPLPSAESSPSEPADLRPGETAPDEVAPAVVAAEDAAPEPSIHAADLLQQRVEAIIAAHAQRTAIDDALRGSAELPENRDALAKLLDDVPPASDFEALDLVYACWGKNTHDSDSRALLAVAQQISRHFGLPDKLPMASTKAWKMLNTKVFAPELADRLAAVGQFIVDWQKTQRVFLILEFSEIELIEYLFEALSPADYPELLAEVMNFKVLSNRRMGLLRRFPARLRKQTQPMLPDRKEEALVIQAHGKALLQKIADPRGFAPIVEVAGKMLEEVEKLMKQTANTGAPPPLGGPPGGGGALGRIG